MHINNELNIIIQGCIDQNRRSQQEFYKTFYGYAAAICMRYSHKKEDLVEIVNDGFLKIFKELHFFKPSEDNNIAVLKAWMRRIIMNTSIDHYRKHIKAEPSILDVDEMNDNIVYQTETPIDKITYDELIKLLSQLTPMYRIVFNMYIIDGLTHEEIAKELKISIGTSKSNLSKARANIIKLIENKHKVIV